jgi:hypothetical protein
MLYMQSQNRDPCAQTQQSVCHLACSCGRHASQTSLRCRRLLGGPTCWLSGCAQDAGDGATELHEMLYNRSHSPGRRHRWLLALLHVLATACAAPFCQAGMVPDLQTGMCGWCSCQMMWFMVVSVCSTLPLTLVL